MMLQSVRWAVHSLWAHRFRSALTVVSVMIGAFAIVFISSLAQSAFETLKRGVEELGGARLLLIVPRQPEKASPLRAATYRPGITPEDRDVVLPGLSHVVEASLYAHLGRKDLLSDAGSRFQADLIAGDSAFLKAFRLDVEQGRPLTDLDDQEQARVCVVGKAVASALWKGHALGRQVSVDGLRCQVVGVLAPNRRFGVGFGFDWEKLVVLPRETVAGAKSQVRDSSLLVVKTDAPASNDLVKRVLNVLLLRRHHGIDNFLFVDFARLLLQFYAAFVIMELIVGALTSFALVIGGIGIMNMMLVSVTERVREIGILRALGARPRHIRMQFLIEAVLLSALGGGAGVGLGALAAVGASTLIEHLSGQWLGSLSVVAILVALGAALGVGTAFGWAPARRAAMLSPVEAMRR